MKINFVRLQNFRNVEFAEADLDSRSVWICGQNAQGKTNLLEALGLLPALRSFRTQNLKALVRQSCKEAAILACVETCGSEYNEIEIRISDRRSVRIDGSEIDKFSDYIGKFPALAMTSEDIRILRDSPDVRRKDVDMFISSIDPQYFAALKKYYAALPHRNALLKDGEQSSAIYEPLNSKWPKPPRIYRKTPEMA
ncbi:MAG: AAA family ATPase [Bacilli bacterium]